jgi:topoisomerase-4 subunit B
MTEHYTAATLIVLEDLQPVQIRPGMYTDTTKPNHLVQEVVDNSVDEALAGFASAIHITVFSDNSIEISDDGRGMPVDNHPTLGMSGIEVIMTKLHAGGKFNHDNYQYSGGLHGVGVSVVNALSSRLDVTVKRQGNIFQMSFSDGRVIKPLTQTGTTTKKDTGTVIRFWPNPIYFDTPKCNIKSLMHTLKAKAVLCKGLSITFYHQPTDETTTWCYHEGLVNYLSQSLEVETLPSPPFSSVLQIEGTEIEWAVTWSVDPPTHYFTESYVNLIPTVQGGTHVNGLRSGLFEAIQHFCELRNLLPRGLKLSADDIFEPCHFVLSVKMKEPQFAGQTKERLSSRHIASHVASAIKDSFALWLNQYRAIGEQLVDFFIERASKRLKQSKQITRKKIHQGPALPGKLADCAQQDLTQAELFLVEGDSAGGSAKQARSKDFQAILPLRGKILNAWEVDSSLILNSQEIHDISIAIGVMPNQADLSNLRYGKVCILADADSDGSHIATLITALFLKHFKPLVKNGHVYIAMPPLFRIDAGKDIYYAIDEDEKKSILSKLDNKKQTYHVQRFKGLGEMNPIQLRETTMDPNTRRLIQLTLEDEAYTIEKMDMLLAKKRASDRKTWLELKGDLASI